MSYIYCLHKRKLVGFGDVKFPTNFVKHPVPRCTVEQTCSLQCWLWPSAYTQHSWQFEPTVDSCSLDCWHLLCCLLPSWSILVLGEGVLYFWKLVPAPFCFHVKTPHMPQGYTVIGGLICYLVSYCISSLCLLLFQEECVITSFISSPRGFSGSSTLPRSPINTCSVWLASILVWCLSLAASPWHCNKRLVVHKVTHCDHWSLRTSRSELFCWYLNY